MIDNKVCFESDSDSEYSMDDYVPVDILANNDDNEEVENYVSDRFQM
jgi:hypothetical protein